MYLFTKSKDMRFLVSYCFQLLNCTRAYYPYAQEHNFIDRFGYFMGKMAAILDFATKNVCLYCINILICDTIEIKH